ncbi:MAG: flagellar basal-body MS-ring/collar protein FliF [Pseudomonadota bacterium]
MTTATEQIGSIFSRIPFQKKVAIGLFLLLVIGGFFGMLMVGSKMEFQPLFGKLSSDDAAIIVDKLKEQRVPFKIEGGGSLILVPADKVYDIRLSLAGLGLPKSGTVGFEIFDKTDFGATEFVQKLNYQRALQGELARTIKEFNEVADARVMIVMPKDSVFIEETKPPSASVMLTLRSELSKSKVAAVVNLVASAVEGLTPDLVTVVDTSGKVLSKRILPSEKVGELADSQLEYKTLYEGNLARRIQSMLEQIAGAGKAIVRVSADMDFSQVDTNEERFDPDAQVLRSRQISTESQDTTKAGASGVSSVSPATSGASDGNQAAEKSQRQNETVNYEINRTTRRTTKPMAEVKRLSIAAVLDGNYTLEAGKDGAQVRKYVARTQAELDQFKKIVQQAMGYSAEREDQVTVESLPFSEMTEMAFTSSPGFDWLTLLRRYGHLAGYAVLIFISFLFIVKPLIQAVSEVSVAMDHQRLIAGSGASGRSLPAPDSLYALPEPTAISAREKAATLTKQDPDKAVEHLRGWLSEAS